MATVHIQGVITHVEPYNFEKVKTIITLEETIHREINGTFTPIKESYYVAINTGLNHHKYYEEAKEKGKVLAIIGDLRVQMTKDKTKIWIIAEEENVYFK